MVRKKERTKERKKEEEGERKKREKRGRGTLMDLTSAEAAEVFFINSCIVSFNSGTDCFTYI